MRTEFNAFLSHLSEFGKTPLTRRRDDLKDHPGQVSLPGGRRENDESLSQTAVREAVEEIGVDSGSIEIIGHLDQVYIPPSDFTIHPFVGWCEQMPQFQVQATEVAELIEADLEWLCRSDSLQFGPIEGPEIGIRSEFFQIEQNQVWGATAKVLMDFRSRLIAAGCG